jgi:hypothetical protein
MACVRGRCPCWPQAEPFDAAEMDLLAAVRMWVGEVCYPKGGTGGEHLWAAVRTRCLAVRCHRRAYVLSTLVHHRREADNNRVYRVHYCPAMACVGDDRTKAQWLLDLGVCPNIVGAVHGKFEGWNGGSVHPGRPPQGCVYPPAQYGWATAVKDLLLSAGMCPVGGCTPAAISQLRQWHRWHGRRSRRLWAAVMG